MVSTENNRIVSGMRPTGKIHLGNYHGALKNWINLQHQYECLFFAADWHALTTDYEDTSKISDATWEMIKDWLAAGLNPSACKIFIQSMVPEHAELHLLLSMIVPLGWLERVPTYKDQKEKLKTKDLSTYGFLGYPALQSSDILIYKANLVPVGEDQVAHVELTREIARRFNHIYGLEPGFEELAETAVKKMGKKGAKLFKNLMRNYREQGNKDALEQGRSLIAEQNNLAVSDKERLYGYLEGSGKIILPEPEALLSETAKMPGLDGQKMSKSYNNTIGITEDRKSVEAKIKVMPTDPARIKRTDPGDPNKCPVWEFHKVYSNEEVKNWVMDGCTTAKIGCLDCKAEIIAAVTKEQEPMIKRAKEYSENRKLIENIVQEGCEAAREIARDTLSDVRNAIGISYT